MTVVCIFCLYFLHVSFGDVKAAFCKFDTVRIRKLRALPTSVGSFDRQYYFCINNLLCCREKK